jgi:hypothetical protein
MTMLRFRIGRIAILVLAFAVGASASARADGFVNPFIGYHFGGNSACVSVANCEQKDLELGLSAGPVGPVLGFEVDLGFGKNFLGIAPNFESSVMTAMGNLLVAPKLGIFRPYGVVGLGLIRTHAELTAIDIPVTDNNTLGMDLGGGLMVILADHVGIRGDVRGFRTLQDVAVFGFTLPDSKIIFGRANIGVVFKF